MGGGALNGVSLMLGGCEVEVWGAKVCLVWGCGLGVFDLWNGVCGDWLTQVWRRIEVVNRGASWVEIGLGDGIGGLEDANLLHADGPSDFGTEQTHLVLACGISVGGAPATGSGKPRGGRGGVRSSRRLAAQEPSSMLEKAVARKARRDDFGRCGGGGRNNTNREKVLVKTNNCGVVLNQGELNSYMEFAAKKN